MTVDYRQLLATAASRWMEGRSGALDDYEAGILAALNEGDLPVALAAHQKLLAWRPGESARHERVARAIAEARDRSERDGTAGLEHMALFSGVPKEELVSMLAAAKPRRARPGEVVVTEGDADRSLFLIVQGTLRVATRTTGGEEISLAALGSGDFFGEVALLTGRPRTATVTALTDSELLELDRESIDRLRAAHPEIEASLSEFHRRRAERTVEALIERLRGAGPSP